MILGILQARMSSSRLPGKTLRPLLGKPLLFRQWERLQKTKKIDQWILATSTDPSDDALETFCCENSLKFFRGSLNDVLDRFYQAALPLRPDHIVRITGDCPLADPALIDQIIDFHLKGNFDYSSNTIPPTFPDGLDAEMFRFACLEKGWKEAKLPSQREHVTPFIYQQPNRFRLGSYKNNIDLSGLRWTVDEKEDLKLIMKIYEALYPHNPNFSTSDILTLLNKHPEWGMINSKYQRNEGYQKSLLNERSL